LRNLSWFPEGGTKKSSPQAEVVIRASRFANQKEKI